jgi:DNA-binding NarL/FixJ family response regulator
MVLVDDHILVRSGIRRLVEELPGLEVVGEADNGEQAIEIIERERPDAVVTDIGMPRMTGLELTAWLTRNLPAVRVAILSMYTSEDYVIEAFTVGARAYLLKNSRRLRLPCAR